MKFLVDRGKLDPGQAISATIGNLGENRKDKKGATSERFWAQSRPGFGTLDCISRKVGIERKMAKSKRRFVHHTN